MSSDIQWFPGHMKKAMRLLEDQVKMVDIILETADARIPFSSRNPELEPIIRVKPRLLILNKSDLADPAVTSAWISHYKKKGIPSVTSDAAGKKGLSQIRELSKDLCSDVLNRAHAKGRMGRPIRAMVVGIPNSGKSTLINSLSHRKSVVTADRPGVTRGFQWVRSDSEMELMDMPGVLWPKIHSKRSQTCLAITGAIRSEVVDMPSLAFEGIRLLLSLYPDFFYSRYKLDPQDFYLPDDIEGDIAGLSDVSCSPDNIPEHNVDIGKIYEAAARACGCLMSGGRVDEERFAKQFVDDFRSGRMGRISLESPKAIEG